MPLPSGRHPPRRDRNTVMLWARWMVEAVVIRPGRDRNSMNGSSWTHSAWPSPALEGSQHVLDSAGRVLPSRRHCLWRARNRTTCSWGICRPPAGHPSRKGSLPSGHGASNGVGRGPHSPWRVRNVIYQPKLGAGTRRHPSWRDHNMRHTPGVVPVIRRHSPWRDCNTMVRTSSTWRCSASETSGPSSTLGGSQIGRAGDAGLVLVPSFPLEDRNTPSSSCWRVSRSP